MTESTAQLLIETLRSNPSEAPDSIMHDWIRADVAGLSHLAEFEGCPVLLYTRLKELGVDEQPIAEFAEWIGSRARRVAARNLIVRAETMELVQQLARLGIPHVLLKGNAFQQAGEVYPHGDARLTNDVDVLLPEGEGTRAWRHLADLGFRSASGRYDSHFHLPPLIGKRGIAVEIHSSTAPGLEPARCWHRFFGTARQVSLNGCASWIPSATELFWHAVTHAPFEWPHAFRFRVFQDAVVVAASGEAVDWTEIAARLESNEIADITVARLWLGTISWLSGNRQMQDSLGITRGFDYARAVRWRLKVFRYLGRDSSFHPLEVWGSKRRAQIGRMLANEATRADTGLAAAQRHWMGNTGKRMLRRAAASVAGISYRAWRLRER